VDYYTDFAAAYVRGRLGLDAQLSSDQCLQHGLQAGLRLHRFKRSSVLPRVRKVLGALHALQPSHLLDLGTGRGVSLWPLLEEFPQLPVTCVDILDYRASDLQAVSRGGLDRLKALQANLTALPFEDGQFPVCTMLEVLEHQVDPQAALREVCRVTGQSLLISVPSKPDDNPEHLHLLRGDQLRDWLHGLGMSRVKLEGVLNHQIVLAQR
jgi:SAM-dependent methyltransferase